MSRKNKIGLDYFSHDTDMSNDLKLKFIKAKYGIIGYAVYNKLLEEIYKDRGYFLEVNERYIILFSDENKLEVNVCIEIINDCINEGLFNHLLHKKYKILTSRRIQENYIKGCERRKSIEFQKKYLLLDPLKVLPENNNVFINIINGNIKHNKCIPNVDINGQRKEEETKEQENEIKENKIFSEDFEKFWDLYDKKIGDRKKIHIKFNKLKEEDRNKIFETLPEYVNSTPDKKFRKNPETYLDNCSWNDEIIQIKPHKIKDDLEPEKF